MIRRVLVTGAAGFVGSALIGELRSEGYGVRAVVRAETPCAAFPPGVECVVADIRDKQKIAAVAVGCGAVVHLAAKVHAIDERGAEEEYTAINVEGTRHLLDAATASGVTRVVFASSVKVFGEETQGCIDETLPPRPRTPYGRSKWRAEQLVSEYAQRGGFTALSLRFPMVYGPTKKGNLYRMIAAIDRGRFPPMPRIASVRSMLHIRNCTQAILLSLKGGRSALPAYIVTDADAYSVTTIYNALRAGLGKSGSQIPVPLWILKAAGYFGDVVKMTGGYSLPLTSETLDKLIGQAWYSPAAFMRDFGYRPAYSFQDAVPDLVAHYRGTLH